LALLIWFIENVHLLQQFFHDFSFCLQKYNFLLKTANISAAVLQKEDSLCCVFSKNPTSFCLAF